MDIKGNIEVFNDIDVSITICDKNFTIIYMNEKAKKTFEKYGFLIGKNLLNCHNNNSKEILQRLIEHGEKNTYTILKNGIKKLIHQTPWYKDGKVAGLIEFSIEIPDDMKHFNRN
jgi:transcriptional regulator with PAS, ATPase and Fis domain